MPNEQRALATIETILGVEPIPDADKIERARIRGWSVVTRKGEFKPGDLCVFFEIDSVLPEHERYAFLKDAWKDSLKGYRLRTKKMRGQISQGLAIPISKFEEEEVVNATLKDVGKDVTQALGVTLYVPPVAASMNAAQKGAFPHFIPKTDEERVQNVNTKHFLSVLKEAYDYDGAAYINQAKGVDMLDVLIDEGKDLVKGGPDSEDPMTPGAVYYVSEKLDGTSITLYVHEGEWGFCSRNYELKYDEEATDVYNRVVRDKELATKLVETSRTIQNNAYPLPTNFAIQGEIVGLGVQGNPYKLEKLELFVFSIFDIDAQEYIAVDSMIQLSSLLSLLTCPFRSVTPTPFVTHSLYGDRDNFQHAFDNPLEEEGFLQKAALRSMSSHQSALNYSAIPEGEVYRPFWSIPRAFKELLSFKVINNRYLLKEK